VGAWSLLSPPKIPVEPEARFKGIHREAAPLPAGQPRGELREGPDGRARILAGMVRDPALLARGDVKKA